MATDTLDRLMQQASQLTVDERLQLIAYLADRTRTDHSQVKRRKWSEIRGIAPYPLAGEDAQAWVTRTRREGDERRERQLRRT